jgi:hypothetical protein
MYEFYSGTRTGLSPGDVGNIQKLYGARPATTWEPAGGNQSPSTAITLAGTDNRVTFGDIASATDPDWYSFVAPATGPTTVTLRTSGLSLFAGRLAVFNSALTRIGFATAGGAGQDLSVALNLRGGTKYFVRIDEAAGTPFAAGQYQAQVIDPTPGDPVVTLGGQPPAEDSYSNETFLTADRLDNVSTNGGAAYRVFAHLRAHDVDTYTIRSPLPGMDQSNVLTATVRAFGDLAPDISVTNALGLPVAAAVTGDGNGLFTVQVNNALPAVDYHLAVDSRTGTVGDYELNAGFRSAVTSPHPVASGLLTILNPQATGTLQVTGSAQIYFRLTSALTPIVGPSVTVTVYDANNQVRFSLLARAGDMVDGVALLGPGSYRVVVSANGALLPSLLSAFTLSLALLTDPVGVTPSDPNDPGSGSNPSPPPSGYNYYNDRGYYVYGEQTPTGSG